MYVLDLPTPAITSCPYEMALLRVAICLHLQALFSPEVTSVKQTKAVCVTKSSVCTEMYDDWLLNLEVEDTDQLDEFVAFSVQQLAQ